MDATASVTASPARPRPWYRLHFSTYVVLLIPLSVLALVAVPGYNVICWEGGMTETYFFQEHGWPLVHSDHEVVVLLAPGASPCLGRDFWSLCEQRSASSLRWAKATGASADRGVVRSGWRDPASWKQTGAEVGVHKAALAINLLVALAICAALAAPYEWWRRRSFRFSLRSLLALFVVAAAVFGYFRWQADQRSREEAVIEQIQRAGFSVSSRYWGPVWLARLVGEEHLGLLHCADAISSTAMSVDANRQRVHVRELFELSAGLHHVSRLNLDIEVTGYMGAAQWERLAEMRNVEELGVDRPPISDAEMACLAKLPKLRVLRIDKLDEASRARLQKALPKCSVVNNSNLSGGRLIPAP